MLLDRINSPEDLKELPLDSLDGLCGEIRELLVNTVSQTGGHLASNLGVVELTVALHRVFDSPHDQIIWDVGHQSYTHKILTGRREAFEALTLRQEDGISGFSRPNESRHDIFYSGHSSTSISAAYGLLQAKELRGDDGYVIAVIGDGALSGGLALEGLNNAGRTKGRLIIVLNDNKMSISKNVGSMARYLAKKRSKKGYVRMKKRLEKALNHIPIFGERLSNFVFRCKTAVKNMIYDSNLFEDFGFSYMGPVDGHKIKDLIEVLQSAKSIPGRPVLLHVSTVKGKGYCFAEENPKQFHGVSKFDIETGDPIHTEKCYSNAFGEYMCDLAEKDGRICAITAAMAEGTGLSTFKQMYKNRFFDVGIAEGHAVTFASGLAKNGMLPVFAVYSTFLQRGFDELIHDAALQNLKVVLAVDRAGFVGEDGESHNGLYDVSYLSSIPGIRILSPSDFAELREALHAALYIHEGVVAVRYPRGIQAKLPTNRIIDCGGYSWYGEKTAKIVLITYGRLFQHAVEAADILRKQQIKIRVVKLNQVRPIEPEAVSFVRSSERIYFFEEGVRTGGAGEAFALKLLEAGYRGKYILTAVDDCFVKQASVKSLMKRYKLDTEGMLEVLNLGTKR